jgi:DNA-binding response OmpR family regulator
MTEHSRPRVALVDDETDVLTFLRLALEDQGYEVLASDQPATAVDGLRAFRPDLICLDLLMPEQMGASLYVDIRRDPALGGTPVLILSGLNAREMLAEILRAGSVPPPAGYIEKPVELPDFLAAVRGALAGCDGGAP